MVDDQRLVGEEDDFTRWDETIFERCLRAGFNPFGSGPTPVFVRHPDADALGSGAIPLMVPDTDKAKC